MAEKSVITNIEGHVRQLIADHERVVQQCDELLSERDALQLENRKLQERVRELDGEISRMQLAEGLTGESNNKGKAKARVNRLMREVDKCIALLNGSATKAAGATKVTK